MDVPHFGVNATFNPFQQRFLIYLPDGTTGVMAKMSDIFLVQKSAVSQGIVHGVQIGAVIILLIVLLLITRKEKLLSMVFFSNAMALLCVAVRGVLAICVVTGPLYNYYRYEVGFYTEMGNAKAVSIAGEITSCLVTIFILISLWFQVKIVLCNLQTWKAYAINIINGVSAFAAGGIRFASMVLNIDWNIVHLNTETQKQFDTIGAVASAANITLIVTICISTIIFTSKLGIAIHRRRSLGIKQFGPMQIIFIAGCQTMIVPLVFTIVVYEGIKHGQITSFVPTVVAISLPLSAMWAAVNVTNTHIDTPHRNNPGAIPVGNPNLDSGKSEYGKQSTVRTSTIPMDERSDGFNSRRGWSVARSMSGGNEEDLELGRLTEDRGADGVYVDRTYSVRTD